MQQHPQTPVAVDKRRRKTEVTTVYAMFDSGRKAMEEEEREGRRRRPRDRLELMRTYAVAPADTRPNR